MAQGFSNREFHSDYSWRNQLPYRRKLHLPLSSSHGGESNDHREMAMVFGRYAGFWFSAYRAFVFSIQIFAAPESFQKPSSSTYKYLTS